MTRSINALFRRVCSAIPYFSGFRKVGTRHIERLEPCLQSVIMETHGFGCEETGEVSVSLWCGHRFPKVPPCFYDARGYHMLYRNLPSPDCTNGLWPIRALDELPTVERSIHEMLSLHGPAWFTSVATPEGFLAHAQEHCGISEAMVLAYHVKGITALHADLPLWLRARPRECGRTLTWLESVGCISAQEGRHLAVASMQEESVYAREIEAFLRTWTTTHRAGGA